MWSSSHTVHGVYLTANTLSLGISGNNSPTDTHAIKCVTSHNTTPMGYQQGIRSPDVCTPQQLLGLNFSNGVIIVATLLIPTFYSFSPLDGDSASELGRLTQDNHHGMIQRCRMNIAAMVYSQRTCCDAWTQLPLLTFIF